VLDEEHEEAPAEEVLPLEQALQLVDVWELEAW
jgi:hypothetical protein